jgi:hypothetical protein
MDAWTLARLAGHSNVRQSMTYVHPSDQALHAAIDKTIVAGSGEIGDTRQELLPSPRKSTISDSD